MEALMVFESDSRRWSVGDRNMVPKPGLEVPFYRAKKAAEAIRALIRDIEKEGERENH